MDEITPSIAGIGNSDTEDYLIQSDFTLSADVLENIWFASILYPYKENNVLTEFECTLSFYNLLTKTSSAEIKKMLEKRGFIFKSVSDNENLIKRAFKWYHPIYPDNYDRERGEWRD